MHNIPLGIVGAAAATPLAQRLGESDQQQHVAASQARQAAGEKQAENASGIGLTDEDQPTADRDADGRRIWEIGTKVKEEFDDEESPAPPSPKDPTGMAGSQIDLSG